MSRVSPYVFNNNTASCTLHSNIFLHFSFHFISFPFQKNNLLPQSAPLQPGPEAPPALSSPRSPAALLQHKIRDSEPQSSACLYPGPQKLAETKGCEPTVLIMPYNHQQAHYTKCCPRGDSTRAIPKFPSYQAHYKYPSDHMHACLQVPLPI